MSIALKYQPNEHSNVEKTLKLGEKPFIDFGCIYLKCPKL